MKLNDLTNALCLALICTLIGMFVLTGCVAQQGDASPDLRPLFQATVTMTGNEYVAARRKLLATPGAEFFLKETQASSKTPDERWLAEILLARLQHGEAIKGLESSFYQKVSLYYLEFPDDSHAKNMHPKHMGGLLAPGEPVPGDDPAGYPYWAKIESLDKNIAASMRAYWESVRVQKSALWSQFCGEIALKGWAPEGDFPVVTPESRREQRSRPPPQPMGMMGSPTFPASYQVRLLNVELAEQAYRLLSKLGERRVAPHVLKVLQDDEQDSSFRATAVICLGRLKYQECLPQLLEICEADEVEPFLYQIVCEMLTRIASEIDSSTAVARLSQIEEQLKEKFEVRAKLSAQEVKATLSRVRYPSMDPYRLIPYSLIAVREALKRLRQRDGHGK